jgi:hypothetical protein
MNTMVRFDRSNWPPLVLSLHTVECDCARSTATFNPSSSTRLKILRSTTILHSSGPRILIPFGVYADHRTLVCIHILHTKLIITSRQDRQVLPRSCFLQASRQQLSSDLVRSRPLRALEDVSTKRLFLCYCLREATKSHIK